MSIAWWAAVGASAVLHGAVQLALAEYRRRRGEPVDWENVARCLACYPAVIGAISLLVSTLAGVQLVPPGGL